MNTPQADVANWIALTELPKVPQIKGPAMASRINRCIDLLEAGHPIYYTDAGELSYGNGLTCSTGE